MTPIFTLYGVLLWVLCRPLRRELARQNARLGA